MFFVTTHAVRGAEYLQFIPEGINTFKAFAADCANWLHRAISLLRLTNQYTVGVSSQLFKINFVLPMRRLPVTTVICEWFVKAIWRVSANVCSSSVLL